MYKADMSNNSPSSSKQASGQKQKNDTVIKEITINNVGYFSIPSMQLSLSFSSDKAKPSSHSPSKKPKSVNPDQSTLSQLFNNQQNQDNHENVLSNDVLIMFLEQIHICASEIYTSLRKVFPYFDDTSFPQEDFYLDKIPKVISGIASYRYGYVSLASEEAWKSHVSGMKVKHMTCLLSNLIKYRCFGFCPDINVPDGSVILYVRHELVNEDDHDDFKESLDPDLFIYGTDMPLPRDQRNIDE